MSVYRRGNSWYIDIRLGGVRINRKAGNSKKEAQTIAAELKTKYRLKMLHVEDISDNFDIFFYDIANRYFKYCKSVKSKRTYHNEKNYYENHIDPEFKNISLAMLTSKLLSDFQEKKKEEGYSNRTVNILLGIIRKIINHNCTDKQVKRLWNSLDVQFPKSLKENTKQHAFLTFDEFDALLPCFKNEMTRLRAVIMRYTGMRPAEAAYLTWTDINFELRKVKIQGKKINKYEWKPKDSEERTIPLSDEAYEALRILYKKRNSTSIWVFSNTDKPIIDMDRALATAARSAGIKKKVSPNILRHTFATLQLASGADIRSIQKIMGHADIRTTMKYLDAIDENLIKAVKAHKNRHSSDKIPTYKKRNAKKNKEK
jgi:integrase